jgi:hypothetical protein
VYPFAMQIGNIGQLAILMASFTAYAAPEGVLLLQSGSGVCAATLLEDGMHAATAYHCVNSRRSIRLSTADGQTVDAYRLATDRPLDLAILKLKGPLQAKGMKIRDSSLIPAEVVAVYGHPFFNASLEIPALEGLLAFSRASGSVSAVGPYLTQLDVAFNPGISGGPVVDEQGRLAGVASRKLKGEQLSFSAPSAPLLEMMASPQMERISGKLSLVGDLDLPLFPGAVPSLHLTPRLILWDWIGVEGSVGWNLGGKWQALSYGTARWNAWKAGAYGRLRFGRGGYSLSADVGGRAVSETRLDGIWGEDGFEFVREVYAARLGRKGWSFGVDYLTDGSNWAPTLTLGTVLAPQWVIF